ncbi:response regulator transcription factor [Saccharibacillus sp. CPCC 101409]|uniref:response regulator transcription factor n=1 Tax=Saccharibacillus sp. CPCC 101409 TaxID=3058041 RepID=UPI0026720FE7|nr:response regulator transcription factor [Saccharibacillus sp. CPCC 101409]MDO3413209.1 response regulator transcription factor [Saccharibacillus sp. CPCC 101409]
MIRIVIAEDQRLLRGAMSSLLSLEDDIEVAGEAGDGEEALERIETLKPDVCLMDIEMPKLSGLDVAERLRAEGAACKVVILTTFARPGYFERGVEAGIRGYLLKDEPVEKLAESIRRVMQGHREVSPELVFGSLREENPLTQRERDILRLAAEGSSAGEIAAALHLSYGTVRNYISETLSKLQVKSRIEAVRLAEEKGWI